MRERRGVSNAVVKYRSSACGLAGCRAHDHGIAVPPLFVLHAQTHCVLAVTCRSISQIDQLLTRLE
jgi:hypothetical protein